MDGQVEQDEDPGNISRLGVLESYMLAKEI